MDFRKHNQDILREKGKIPFWLIGEKLDVHEVTVGRWLNKKLEPDKRDKILEAIREIKREYNM